MSCITLRYFFTVIGGRVGNTDVELNLFVEDFTAYDCFILKVVRERLNHFANMTIRNGVADTQIT